MNAVFLGRITWDVYIFDGLYHFIMAVGGRLIELVWFIDRLRPHNFISWIRLGR